jgi:hypothetical protein
MPQGQPARGERQVGLRQANARLEDRGQGALVDGRQPVQPAQVERDQGVERAALGLEPAHHARAAAEGHHGHPGVRAHFQRGLDLLGIAG